MYTYYFSLFQITFANYVLRFRVLVVNKEGEASSGSMDSGILTQTLDSENSDGERVSTGTKFALEQWLHLKKSI